LLIGPPQAQAEAAQHLAHVAPRNPDAGAGATSAPPE
jgi:hypothetical protein